MTRKTYQSIGLIGAVIAAIILTPVTSPHAATYNAGDSCSTAGAIHQKNDSGGYYFLVCDGSNWIQGMSIDKDGNFGIGESSNGAAFHVGGEVVVGNTNVSCTASLTGGMRYSATDTCMQFCNGATWACMTAPSSCADSTPDAYVFSNLVNQSTATIVTSDIIQVNGISCAVSVSASGDGSPQVRVCSDASCATVVNSWTNANIVEDGQYIQARLTSPATAGAVHGANITVGNATDYWTVTTTFADCTGTVPVGTVCSDGTVYAGTTPDGYVDFYVTRCDSNQYWSGTACVDCSSGHWTGSGTTCTTSYGTNSGIPWRSGSGANVDVGLNSGQRSTGESNTDHLANLSDTNSPYLAADYCYNLTANGHSDWYLPGVDELVEVYKAANSISGLSTGTYAASHQRDGYNYYEGVYMGTGGYARISKTSISSDLRCARK